MGSGPAGSTVARELVGSGLRVVLIESGSAVRDPEADELNDIEDVGRRRQPDQWQVRNRVLGGSSETWWGRCRPFDRIDFEQRPWVTASGWPIESSDLDPFRARATQRLGLPPMTAEPESCRGDRRVHPITWWYSRDDDLPRQPMRFGARLRQDLGDRAQVLLDTTAVAIRTRPDGGVDHVEVADRSGARSRITAARVVLAAGGIENARLLLVSRLGGDLVGRYLMDHPRGTVARFDARHAGALLRRFGWARTGGARRMRGLALDPAVQREERLLNAAAWPEAVPAHDDPITALRRTVARGRRPSDLVAVVRGIPLLIGTAVGLLAGNGVQHRFREVTLEAICEQMPDPDSRVTLSDRRDHFGVPLPRTDWHLGRAEVDTLRRTAELVAHELEALGLPVPILEPWLQAGELPPPEWTDIAHPTGTTRMAEDPELGVVDRAGEVHGVPGLFVAGSSVFPTAGHANPTFTIVALAIRLADHLRADLAAPVAAP